MKLDILNLSNQKVGDVELDPTLFGLPVRRDILHRVVRWQLAKRRAGTHSTKTISMVSGTTKKPFKQKGTGNARQGSLRSPQMRGGAVIFGPLPRDHGHELPKKVRKLGLKTALSAKAAEGKLIILDNLTISSYKTKEIVEKLSTLGLNSALFIDNEVINANFKNAISNIAHVDALPQIGANVYDILRHNTLVITRDALTQLEGRLK